MCVFTYHPRAKNIISRFIFVFKCFLGGIAINNDKLIKALRRVLSGKVSADHEERLKKEGFVFKTTPNGFTAIAAALYARAAVGDVQAIKALNDMLKEPDDMPNGSTKIIFIDDL